MKRSFLKFITVVILFSISISIYAGSGVWTSSGPDGGKVMNIVADPTTEGTFYALARGGVYKSSDGGSNWVRSNNGLAATSLSTLRDIVHHQTLSNVLYVAGHDAVYKTTDGGINWASVGAGLPIGDHITALSLAPLASNVVFVAVNNNGLHKSTDGGGSWFAINNGLPTEAFIYKIVISPTDTNRVYVTILNTSPGPERPGGLYESIDGGISWANVSAAIPSPYTSGNSVHNISFTGFAGEIYLKAGNSLYKSSDDGASWVRVLGVRGERIAVNPIDNTEVIISGTTGLWRTFDGGTSWTQTLANFAGNATGVADSTVVAYDPFNPARKLAGTVANGVYSQTLNGFPWVQQAAGMDAANIRALEIHPVTTSRIYAGSSGTFSPALVSFISNDSGTTWDRANSGLQGTYLRDLEIDPFTAATVSGTHVYAVGYKQPSTALTGGELSGDGGIYKSIDGGTSWITIDAGIPLTTASPSNSYFGIVRDITLDLSSSVAGGAVQTLYVAGSGWYDYDDGVLIQRAARIYKSTNAGASWFASDAGIDQRSYNSGLGIGIVKIVIDPENPLILYAASFRFRYLSVVPAVKNGIWKSIDGGANWTHSSTGLPRVDGPDTSHFSVLSLAIDPTNPSRLYASAHDPETFLSQIYKSEDSGASWSLANSGMVVADVRDILVDSVGVVYAAATSGRSGNPGGVYRSKDFGDSWQSISVGLESFVSVLHLEIDQSGPNDVLYAGTTQSIQSIELLPDTDNDGVANSIEASTPASGDGNADGIADAKQSNVASLLAPAVDVDTYSQPLNSSNYVTIEVTPVSGSCTALVDVQAMTDQTIPNDTPWQFEFGIVRFELVDCQEATVRLIYHASTSFSGTGRSMRIFAPEQVSSSVFKWQTLSATTSEKEWVINLIDGQRGDFRIDPDRILFQGGPGLFKEGIFAAGFE